MGVRPKRIAVMRYRFIGDTLLTMPFCRALQACYPDAEITGLVSPSEIALFENTGIHVTAFDPRHHGFWQTLFWLRQQEFDRIYVLKRSFSSALLAFLAGIPERIGFATEGRDFCLTHSIPYRAHRGQHELACLLDCLEHDPVKKQMPFDPSYWEYGIVFTSDEIEIARERLTSSPLSDRPIICLGLFSSNRAKNWPLDAYAKLAKQLIETHDIRLLFLGTETEQQAVSQWVLEQELPADRILNQCGQTSLRESLAMLTHCHGYIGNDSGLMHLAAAAEIPTVAIFGPTDPKQWHPLGANHHIVTIETPLSCQPCRMKITCDHRYPCLAELTVEKVFSACQTHLFP